MEEPTKPNPKVAFRRRKHLQAQLENITQEMYKRNLELADTNKVLSLLRSIDTMVLESQEPLPALSKRIASAIIETTSFPFAAILAHKPHTAFLEPYGWQRTGLADESKIDSFKQIRIDVDSEWLKDTDRVFGVKLTPKAMKDAHRYLGLDAATAGQLFEVLALKSLHFIKLHARQRLVGVLVVGKLQSEEKLSESEQLLVERLGDAIGVAVDNKFLFEENQRVLKQMQKTNEKLQALDEAKDEFISMASHQLRTPLTSVKGYVSMVMEGDAGKITDKQAYLLEAAFTSSQRMVYLIADLLNVSRLKTGKFLIEPKEVDMAKLIQSEVDQLQETAKSRSLKLTYKAPKGIPTVMLDENKIRQVAMNFLDNAIYYTPSGGEIRIELGCDKKSLWYKVYDNGIGVPKSEQHKLFGKFYRAGNARKARPDGTGLGLFMAKKVVVAQGGAVLFESKEGQGSMFGFTFPLSKIKVKS